MMYSTERKGCKIISNYFYSHNTLLSLLHYIILYDGGGGGDDLKIISRNLSKRSTQIDELIYLLLGSNNQFIHYK